MSSASQGRRRFRPRKPKAQRHVGSSAVSDLVSAIRCNDFAAFSSLLAAPDMNVNCHTSEGDVPLVEACRFAHQQNDIALQILEQILTYAKQQDQLRALETAKPDKVNSLVHVAAGLSNWKALKMLREKADEFGLDFHVRNAVEHSALHVVEMNSFQARSLLFCEPPRPEAETGRTKKSKGRKRRKNQKKEDEEVKQEQEQQEEPQSQAESVHVIRTVLELAKPSGIGAIFSRKGDEGLRGLYIKALVLAEVGLVRIVNEVTIALMADTQKEKVVYLDGLMYTVASVYPLSVKNAKEYQSLWLQALNKKPAENIEAATADNDDQEEKKTAPAEAQHTVELSHEGFKLILNGILSYNSLSKRVKVWTLILMHLLTPFARESPLTADMTPVMEECGQLKFYERIIEMLYRSGTKLAFCIFDRTDIEDDESYDEEIEFHLLISLFELFLQFFTPYARTIRDDKGAVGITESFQRSIKPIKLLWQLVNAALGSLDDAIATPQRFSLLLHLLQVFEQLEAAFVADEDATLVKLFGIMKRFVKQEAKKKRIRRFVAEQTHLLHTIAAAFPMPTSFVEKVIPLKDSVDVLIRSDPKVLGMDFAVFKRSLQFVLDHDFDAEPLDMRFEYTTEVVIVDEAKQKEESTDGTVANPMTTTMEMELQEGMGNVEVTNTNKAQYVLRRAQQFFFGNELMYYKRIRDGFNDTIVRSDLKLFRPEELRHLVQGERTIDFKNLKANVVYSRGASPSRGVIQYFWDVVESFDQELRSKLLTFWSGSPLPPIFGFDSKYRSMNADTACWYIDVDTRMQPNFCPMANTCDRRLILPDYSTCAALKEKLLVALEHGSVGYDRM
eukprot:jgi/Phyca11/535409/estExt2_fgenesh1_pg.C_PHYCAscaffold_350072